VGKDEDKSRTFSGIKKGKPDLSKGNNLREGETLKYA
jgi:hypothetical protein